MNLTVFIPPVNSQKVFQYPLTAMITTGVHKKKRLRNLSSLKLSTQFNRQGVFTPGMAEQ
jgi:hypothetical protein